MNINDNKNNTRSFSSNFKPIFIYKNSLLNKPNVLKENKDKSGIYRWVNTINNESYIGSSINLSNRLRKYYSLNYLNNKLKIDNSRIYRAILKYGCNNFDLEILEYCSKKSTISREQYYIDLFKPAYNILEKAGSCLGFKHSTKTLLKFKNRDLGTGHVVSITNKENGSTKEYISIRAAARSVSVSHTTLLNYININKPLKDIYLVTNIPKSVKSNKLDLSYNVKHKTIKVFDSSNNFINDFSSIRSVAKYIGVDNDIIISSSTISSYIKSGKLYKNKYYFR